MTLTFVQLTDYSGPSAACNTASALYFVGCVLFEVPANVCYSNPYILHQPLGFSSTISSLADHALCSFHLTAFLV